MVARLSGALSAVERDLGGSVAWGASSSSVSVSRAVGGCLRAPAGARDERRVVRHDEAAAGGGEQGGGEAVGVRVAD